ncbi:hypothetical protein LTR70_003656 [Exophiala xenobiotica]|uniref:XPG-I domain-containing protein n=1 Tax=Lithohypha guttulata TaxID=1690604 RepID=A0ABR0KG00_9EURO|nr:hypothetical protein LTR24_003153 [Lithohypha guttulata]KAK5322869.1 hypothetical protein LTR70_003656 [Exophiala xenobiotica]
MGIPGLLKEIGKGERVALAKLAIDHFEKHKRPLRIAIDAAIWNFQNQAGQGGKNPALRTLFFRLLKLLALPIHPVFVYDGKNKPLTKRGKTVSRYGTCIPNELSKNLVARFQFPHHTAPGEAEAECAFMQKHGIVDAVMSQDADAIMFGSTLTLRDWSKEGTKGNKTPTHVNVLDEVRIKEVSGLDAAGMILVALLSGGDYHEGVPGFGPALSCSIARAGFGQELVELVQEGDDDALREWRQRLQYELETNESGYFLKRHKTIQVPDDFPNRTIMSYYLDPAVSKKEDMKKLEDRWLQWWKKEIDIPGLRDYVGMTFDWLYKGGARNFIRKMAQPLFQHHLKMQWASPDALSTKSITDRRKHFVTNGIAELRLSVVPANVVGVDLDAEEENPEFAEIEMEAGEDEVEAAEDSERQATADAQEEPSSPTKRKQRPPWDPYSPEKWWIPEILLRQGLPTLVDGWEQEQKEIRSDPVKFATRKCKPAAKASKKIDQSMKHGALREFLPVTRSPVKHREGAVIAATSRRGLAAKKKPLERSRSNPLTTLTSQETNIEGYFRMSKPSQVSDDDTSHVSDRPSQNLDFPDVCELFSSKSQIRGRSPLLRCQTMPAHSVVTVDPNQGDVELPTTVTRRRKRQPKDGQPKDDDDLVFVGTTQLPPPISSFFAANIGNSRRPKPQLSSVLGTKPPLVPPDPVAVAINKKVAISRDSLPGAWRELPITPSQNSRISVIDLTNM